jgi:hypothetical protein
MSDTRRRNRESEALADALNLVSDPDDFEALMTFLRQGHKPGSAFLMLPADACTRIADARRMDPADADRLFWVAR